jgi:hypothetical protein
MKKKVVALFLAMFVIGVASAFAGTPNFAGEWKLDVSKSKLPEMMRIESMTMTVAQSEKELKYSTATKRKPRPEGEMGGQGGGQARGGPGGGQGRGGMGGDGTFTFSLDGKETTAEVQGFGGPSTAKLKATLEKDGKLKLSNSRSMSTPMGEIEITTKETWVLSADGKTLTVTKVTNSPRGEMTSEMVFEKNDSSSTTPTKAP